MEAMLMWAGYTEYQAAMVAPLFRVVGVSFLLVVLYQMDSAGKFDRFGAFIGKNLRKILEK